MVLQPAILTGQQIGAGWTPALSVVKALTALVEARRKGLRAVYWMADEDHDRHEVAQVFGLQGERLLPHRFRFEAPRNTATGWLPWTSEHQREARDLWGELPEALSPDLRGHVLALGSPLWQMGLEPFSPTRAPRRPMIQDELERWRRLGLEADLIRQAERLEAEGAPLPLDPRAQGAWFSLNPATGLRRRLEPEEPCPIGCWLSPGAALRPLMQSLLLPVEGVVLGPAERAYWRLTEPLWERVGLQPPRIIPRPTVFVVPRGLDITGEQLPWIREGQWERLLTQEPALPSRSLPEIAALASWSPAIEARFQAELNRTRGRLEKLDRRVRRDAVADRLGQDPERLRQLLFPLSRPQERILPGLFWLRKPALLERMIRGLESGSPLLLIPDDSEG